MVGFGVLGTVCWAVLAGVMWTATSTRFRQLTGRTPLPRPYHPQAAARLNARVRAGPRAVGPGDAARVRPAGPDEVLDVEPIEEDRPDG
jgi:hypothetical protein